MTHQHLPPIRLPPALSSLVVLMGVVSCGMLPTAPAPAPDDATTRLVAETRAALDQGEFEVAYEAARQGKVQAPENRELAALYLQSLVWTGHLAFVNGDYPRAAERYRQLVALRGDPSSTSWTYGELITAVEDRARLGVLVAPSVHRVGVVYVVEQRQLLPDGGAEISGDVTESQKRTLRVYQGLMQRLVEAFSGGAWTLEFEEVDAIATFAAGDGYKPANPDHLNLGEFFLRNSNRFDTFITCSNTTSPAMGLARAYPYVNGVLYGPSRGMVALNPASHGWDTWFHEFFHVVEWVSGGIGGPTHGYRPGDRAAYPGWTGTTELDYYRWHFQHTLPRIGWENLNHRSRWPVRAIDVERFAALAEVYQTVPLVQRMEADQLLDRARPEKNEDEARQLVELALEASPYHPEALQWMADYFDRSAQVEAGEPYRQRLRHIASVAEFHTVTPAIGESGSVVGTWHPGIISRHGTITSWQAGAAIAAAGTYEVSLYYTEGWHGIDIDWVGLYGDGREVSRDSHAGFSGNKKEEIVYTVSLESWQPAALYEVRAKMSGSGGIDSRGVVVMRRVGD